MLRTKVSVIIPYSKDRGYLNQAIESIKNQNFGGDIEIILSKSDKSVSYNLNEGIKTATGEFVKYLCDDDMLTPNSLADSVEAIQGFDFVHGKAINFFENGVRNIYVPRVPFPDLKQMKHQNIIHGGSLMYRRDVFERFNVWFDESLTCAEEYDLNMHLLSKGAKLGYCPSTLYLYRRHSEQKSLGKQANQKERAIKIKAIQDRYGN